MIKVVDGTIVQLTPEEIAHIEYVRKVAEAKERYRPFEPTEVHDLIVKSIINQVVFDDQISLRMKNYYPSFEEIVGHQVPHGFKFTYKDKLYRTIQPNLTVHSHYLPDLDNRIMYERIYEIHVGDIYDPIPFEKGMVLINTKYYIQNGITYLCERDSVTALQQPLSELVGIYVTVVKQSYP